MFIPEFSERENSFKFILRLLERYSKNVGMKNRQLKREGWIKGNVDLIKLNRGFLSWKTTKCKHHHNLMKIEMK